MYYFKIFTIVLEPKGCETSKNVPLQSDQEMKELKHEVMALQFANKQLQKELIIKVCSHGILFKL